MVWLKFSLRHDTSSLKLHAKNDEFCLGDFWLETSGNLYAAIPSLRNAKNWVWERNVAFRDCSLFMPKGGLVFRVGGESKIFKINEKRGVFF